MTFKMNMKIFRIFSSWDFDQDEVVFSTKENAMEWLKNHPDIKYILEDCSCDDVEQMISECLIDIGKIELDPPPLAEADDEECEENGSI